MDTNFDAKIADCERQIDGVRKQMEDHCGVLFDAIAAMANPWYDTTFKAVRDSQPSVIVDLGEPYLVSIASDFKQFLRQTRFEVEQLAMRQHYRDENFSHLTDYKNPPMSPYRMWHENAYLPPKSPSHHDYKSTNNFPLLGTLESVAQRLTAFLTSHKLRAEHVAFKNGIPWSNDYKVALEDHNRLHNQQLKLLGERAGWIQKRTEAKAKELLGKVFG